MPIRVLAQRNALAAAYGSAAPYLALFTSDPGTSGSATPELTGGSPAYARKSAAWSAPTASAISGTSTFDVASGSSVSYVGACVSVTAGTADVRDSVLVTTQPFSSQGTYTATATYTQS